MIEKINFLVYMTDHQRGDIKDICAKAITPNLDSRITSYNVCYTKLLRLFLVQGHL